MSQKHNYFSQVARCCLVVDGLLLIEIVWSWMVVDIANTEGGWSRNPEDLMAAVLRVWDNVSIESFRELVRSYRHRLLAIKSVGGDRHPSFA